MSIDSWAFYLNGVMTKINPDDMVRSPRNHYKTIRFPPIKPSQLKLGWIVSEEIGIGVVNPRGLRKFKKRYRICA